MEKLGSSFEGTRNINACEMNEYTPEHLYSFVKLDSKLQFITCK